jgi:hypothetical protein
MMRDEMGMLVLMDVESEVAEDYLQLHTFNQSICCFVFMKCTLHWCLVEESSPRSIALSDLGQCMLFQLEERLA